MSAAAASSNAKASGSGINVLSLGVGMSVPGKAPVSSLDFHGQGEYLVSGAEDGTVHLINALEGRTRKTVHCRKYGVGLVRFTHHELSVLHTSKPSPNSTAPGHIAHEIRYLSLFDNAYLRFFTGHEGRVTSLAMSPLDDRFLSASVDGTLRLWALQQPTAIAMGRLPQPASGRPALAAFDPEGIIFAACARIEGQGRGQPDCHVLKLFDSKAFGSGAFETKAVTDLDLQKRLVSELHLDAQTAHELATAAWTGLSFSPDGHKLLVTTRAHLTLVFESSYLQLERMVVGYANSKGLDIGACFTPDGQFLLTGSEDGDVCVFDGRGKGERVAGEERAVHRLEGHSNPVRQVLCNHKYEVVASACSNVVLWVSA